MESRKGKGLGEGQDKGRQDILREFERGWRRRRRGEGSGKEEVGRRGLRKVWEGGWRSVISSAWSCPPFPAGLPEGHAHALR